MPAVSRATTWADSTEVSALGAAAILEAVRWQPGSLSTADVFLQLWNLVDPTPGVDLPDLVLPIRSAGGTAGSTMDRVRQVDFNSMRFGTALTWFVSTTPTGAVAPTGVNVPGFVEVYFTPSGGAQ